MAHVSSLSGLLVVGVARRHFAQLSTVHTFRVTCAEGRGLCCAAPHGNGIHAAKAGRNGKQSGSCNSSGLLSHHMRGAAEANGNGNGYSSRHSSELSMEDDWEPRPPSASAIGKVGLSMK